MSWHILQRDLWLPEQESQLPDSANLRVLVALRNVFAHLKHGAASSPHSVAASGQLPGSRAASPFALPGGAHAHAHSWGSESLDSLVASSMAVRAHRFSGTIPLMARGLICTQNACSAHASCAADVVRFCLTSLPALDPA